MGKTKLITIDYDEYLNLVGCKEILEEAIEATKNAEYNKYSLDPYPNMVCFITATKLFNTLCFDSSIREIRIERYKNDKTN